MRNKVIDELFLLRSIACLSIVLLHALARVYAEDVSFVNSMSLLLTFGTPTFVFISEFVLAYSYSNKQPEHFWSRRVKYILLPYIFFGAFYAMVKALEVSSREGTGYGEAALQLIWKHILLGDYHGYFILIIFQFYVLHGLFVKYVQDRFSPKLVIGVSLIVQLLYLGFFNLVKAPANPVGAYIWGKMYWIPFVGWFSYFTIAFYCGRYFERFRQLLLQNAKWIIAAPVITAIFPLVMYQMGVYNQLSSKRFDMVLFVIAMTFFLYLIALRMRSVPNVFVRISQFSFGIYLFHPLYMAVLKAIENKLPFTINPILMVLVYFLCGVVPSAVTVYLLNKTQIGPYLVGRLGISRGKKAAPDAIEQPGSASLRA